MTEKMEEIIISELFKLSEKVNNLQENMVTKDDIKELKEYTDKRFAEQTEYIDQRFEEQEKKIEERFAEQTKYIDQRFEEQEKKIEERFAEQAKDIGTILNDAFRLSSKFHREIEERTDEKIATLKRTIGIS